jgi:hypothetical protein
MRRQFHKADWRCRRRYEPVWTLSRDGDAKPDGRRG